MQSQRETRETWKGLVKGEILEIRRTGGGLCVIFFFSSRRRHTRQACDWSSDVCSSDLGTATPVDVELDKKEKLEPEKRIMQEHYLGDALDEDRKSVVQGKSVDLGGRRIIKKKKKKNKKKKTQTKKKKNYLHPHYQYDDAIPR